MQWRPGEQIVRREILRGRPWLGKDDGLLETRMDEGRFTAAEIDEIRAEGARIGAMLDAGERWWDAEWSRWSPPRDWEAKPLPKGWDVV